MKNFFKHPIVVSVISALIVGTIVAPVVAYVKSQSFWEAIKTIGSFIIDLFDFGVPLWIILLVLILFSLVKKAIKRIDSNTEPHFTTYCEDFIDGVQWEWNWVLTGRGYTFRSPSPNPYCRSCKGSLVVNEIPRGIRSYDCLVCENCGFRKDIEQRDFKEYHGRIKREIERRLRTGQWKTKDNLRI